MPGPQRSRGPAGQPDAGPLGADIASFRLHLAAEAKAPRTVQGYTGAVRWFAAGYLLGQAGKTRWEQVSGQNIEQWMIQLLDRYSDAYAAVQFRALQQFFKWLSAEDQIPDSMTRLRAPMVAVREVPVFTSVELSALAKACHGSTFAARRDAAIIAVFTAAGIRLSELAGIRYDPHDPARSDLDLHAREIRIAGKAGRPRTVRIGHQAARSLDRYLRARARHLQAWRPQLWLGMNSRGPLTPTGIYQIIACRGRQCGVTAYPHRFRHHFSYTWLDRGGAEQDLMELNCSARNAATPLASHDAQRHGAQRLLPVHPAVAARTVQARPDTTQAAARQPASHRVAAGAKISPRSVRRREADVTPRSPRR